MCKGEAPKEKNEMNIEKLIKLLAEFERVTDLATRCGEAFCD